MPPTFQLPHVELRPERKYIDKEYIGFVLDVVTEYLGIHTRVYYLNSNNLSEATRIFTHQAGRNEGNGDKIVIDKIVEGQYKIEGFPPNRDFEDFKKQAPSLFEQILNR